MTELLTVAQMRAAEDAAISAGTVTGSALMARAGQGVVNAIQTRWPDLRPDENSAPHAVVLCGPGNNGGDGYVIAQCLFDLDWQVEVLAFGDADRLPSDAAAARTDWLASGAVQPVETAGQGARPDIIIDALLGLGVTRPLPLEWASAFHSVARRAGRKSARVVAVDGPSGCDLDTGHFILPPPPDDPDETAFSSYMKTEAQPRLLRCDLCVTFHRAKPGHYLATLGDSRPVVVDIGLPDGPDPASPDVSLVLSGHPNSLRLVAPSPDTHARAMRRWIGETGFDFLRHDAHKYDRGHALVLGGGVGHGGAARMAAGAALRSGAGLVTLAVPPDAIPENAAQLTAVMLRPLPDASAFADLLSDDRLSALCLGPGLGLGSATQELVSVACRAATATADGAEPRRIVLDADALTSFADDPTALFSILPRTAVLTPHMGEFARLFPDLAPGPFGSPLVAAQAAADRAGCIILLKGPTTVIASPGGPASLVAARYDLSAPWLGTAGAGDVLAGMITGLAASPMAAFNLHQRVELAAFLHAEAARTFGPGLIATDLIETLPRVLSRYLG